MHRRRSENALLPLYPSFSGHQFQLDLQVHCFSADVRLRRSCCPSKFISSSCSIEDEISPGVTQRHPCLQDYTSTFSATTEIPPARTLTVRFRDHQVHAHRGRLAASASEMNILEIDQTRTSAFFFACFFGATFRSLASAGPLSTSDEYTLKGN